MSASGVWTVKWGLKQTVNRETNIQNDERVMNALKKIKQGDQTERDRANGSCFQCGSQQGPLQSPEDKVPATARSKGRGIKAEEKQGAQKQEEAGHECARN